MKFAYADPPYFNQGKKRYGEFHPDAAIWDKQEAHIDLINKLVDEYPDGWALSCNPRDLQWLLPHCPETVRVCSWVKTFHQIRPTTVQFAWEPVLLGGGEKIIKENLWLEIGYLVQSLAKKVYQELSPMRSMIGYCFC